MAVGDLLATGKKSPHDGLLYNVRREFDERNEQHVVDKNLFKREALIINEEAELWEFVRPELEAKGEHTILEIGCGFGRIIPVIVGTKCAHYHGVDLTQHRVDFARKKYGSEKVTFGVADVRTWRPKDKYDLVIESTVVQHLLLGDKKLAVEAMVAGVKDDGILLFMDDSLFEMTLAEAEEIYASPKMGHHMIPLPISMLAEWVAPRKLVKFNNRTWKAIPDMEGDPVSSHAVRLNFGCGATPLKDYVNIDSRQLPGVEHVCNVFDLAEHFNAGTVDEIVSTDFIEHVSWRRWKEFFGLMLWLLKRGGTVRHKIPNAALIAKAITCNGDLAFIEQYGCGLQTLGIAEEVHRALWWPEMARKVFGDAGFSRVRITDADFKHFVVEAVKP